jgi:hypothetical protein
MGDLRTGIIHITRDDGPFWTDDYAGWFQTDLSPVSAVMTFSRRLQIGINVNRIIWTGLHTGFAADADLWIKINNSIMPLVHGCNRTNADTGWIRTMIAARDLKMAPCIWVATCFHIFHPGPVNAQRNPVLTLAGSGTGMATDTLAIVNDETVIHK